MPDKERGLGRVFSRLRRPIVQSVPEGAAAPTVTSISAEAKLEYAVRIDGLDPIRVKDQLHKNGGYCTDSLAAIDYLKYVLRNDRQNKRKLFEIEYSADNFSMTAILENIIFQERGERVEISSINDFWSQIGYSSEFDLLVRVDENFPQGAERMVDESSGLPKFPGLRMFEGNMRANLQNGSSRILIYSPAHNPPTELGINLPFNSKE